MDKPNEPTIVGAHHLTINTQPTSSLENMHTIRITERIQIESEIADILREETLAVYMSRYKH